MNERKTEYAIGDTITGRPHDFLIGDQHFSLYPLTLGKMIVLRPYMDEAGMDVFTREPNPYISVLKLVKSDKTLCATILSVHTARNCMDELFDYEAMERRRDTFVNDLADKDLAALLVMALTGDKTREIMEYLGMREEQERVSEAVKAKENSRNTLHFGAKGIFGSFIVPLKEMGFSISEIVFECSYSFLQLLLMDRQISMYMSDDEISRMGGSAGAMIDGGDTDSRLEAFAISRGLHVEKRNRDNEQDG